MKFNFKTNLENDLLKTESIISLLIKNYRSFYNGLIDKNIEERHSPFIHVWLERDGFNNTIYLQKKFWYFDPPNEKRISRDFFLELTSPKGYQVNDPDGKHYDYYDIHEKEPMAKKIFEEIKTPINKITKPLCIHRFGKIVPEYQIRISKLAWDNLSESAFIRGPGQLLTTKW